MSASAVYRLADHQLVELRFVVVVVGSSVMNVDLFCLVTTGLKCSAPSPIE